jgi:hypothetical protein
LQKKNGDWELFIPSYFEGPAFYNPNTRHLDFFNIAPNPIFSFSSPIRAWNGECMATMLEPFSYQQRISESLITLLDKVAIQSLPIFTSCGDAIDDLVPQFDMQPDSLHFIDLGYTLNWDIQNRLQVLVVGSLMPKTQIIRGYSNQALLSDIPETEVVISTWQGTVWIHETVSRSRRN